MNNQGTMSGVISNFIVIGALTGAAIGHAFGSQGDAVQALLNGAVFGALIGVASGALFALWLRS